MHLHTHPHRPVRRLRGGLAALAGCLVLAAALPGVAGVFPDQAALTLKFADDFESGSIAPWTEWENVSTNSMGWQVNTGTALTSLAGGSWGAKYLYGWGQSRSWWGNLLPDVSLPTDPSWNAGEWTNIQMEMDLVLRQTQSPGFIWAAKDEDGDRSPETGYIFRLRGVTPSTTSYDDIPGGPAQVETFEDCTGWELRQITAENTYQLIARSDVNSACTRPLLPPTETYTVADPIDTATKYLLHTRGYRMRLSWYCGNLQVQIVRVYNPVGTDPPVFYGCGDACTASGSTDVEDCWCTLVQWSPLPLEEPLDPGAVGVHESGTWSTSAGSQQYFDNFKVSYWEPDCGVVCGPWQGWQTVRTDIVPFKFLYEGGVFDISAGRRIEPAADRGKIDVATEAPGSVSGYNHSLDSNPYCNGWNLLEDLPAPAETTNLDEILAFLEPMHSAVKYEVSGGTPIWVDDYDNDPASASYNPVPMVADGSTPINSSLLEAYDWYRDQVTAGDWADDPY
ncbi:MAG TPA: hypothetical protein VLT32_22705, partial [Candidatus Sulfomarinibacteraceae bacterium]|nr:hypothetical protein [Candidatus Sulfomarinibacteraceae bacterium]